MNTFLLNKTQYYIERSDEYLALLKYITGDHKDFTLIKGKWEKMYAYIYKFYQELNPMKPMVNL